MISPFRDSYILVFNVVHEHLVNYFDAEGALL